MTVAEAPALYEAAFRGEPLQRTVFPEPLNTHDTFWTIGDWPIRVPSRRLPCHPTAPADHPGDPRADRLVRPPPGRVSSAPATRRSSTPRTAARW